MSEEAEAGYELTEEEFLRVTGLSEEARLQYFSDKCWETNEVWTVGSGDELLVLAGEGDQPFVVTFPHPEFAEEWFPETGLEDVDLVAISTEDWVAEILPGLEEEGINVAVFPAPSGDAAGMTADTLAKYLRENQPR